MVAPQLCRRLWPPGPRGLQTQAPSWRLSPSGWTASRPAKCATRTLTAAPGTGWCASALWAKRRRPCWTTTRSARLPWKCCWSALCTTAAAREGWRRSCSVCRPTGPSTWALTKVGSRWSSALQKPSGYLNKHSQLIVKSTETWFLIYLIETSWFFTVNL